MLSESSGALPCFQVLMTIMIKNALAIHYAVVLLLNINAITSVYAWLS